MRVPVVENEPYMAEAIRAGLRLEARASGFELGADDYLTKPFELQELVLRPGALDRRHAHKRPPVREFADPRKRLGEPWSIATVPGVGHRIGTGPEAGSEGDERG
ncbi:response regulator [Actinomadura harenae]|uniref:Response regulatory domain-containing protein n=1 Tax=Actinomadura harenae TaxID=2483351 RepID=A0A3M2M5E2_9ACTN|nr:hypothetical protein [Actinomadura harenae]RMI44907.1 hypothetical protein EBO15_11570 [Actinomadura harenae]